MDKLLAGGLVIVMIMARLDVFGKLYAGNGRYHQETIFILEAETDSSQGQCSVARWYVVSLFGLCQYQTTDQPLQQAEARALVQA